MTTHFCQISTGYHLFESSIRGIRATKMKNVERNPGCQVSGYTENHHSFQILTSSRPFSITPSSTCSKCEPHTHEIIKSLLAQYNGKRLLQIIVVRMILTKRSREKEGQQRYQLFRLHRKFTTIRRHNKGRIHINTVSKKFTILYPPNRPAHLCKDLLPLYFLHQLYQTIL